MCFIDYFCNHENALHILNNSNLTKKKDILKTCINIILNIVDHGSDAANITTSAKLEGDNYILNGSKVRRVTFLTANWL